MEFRETHWERTELSLLMQGKLLESRKWLLNGVAALTESQKERENI